MSVRRHSGVPIRDRGGILRSRTPIDPLSVDSAERPWTALVRILAVVLAVAVGTLGLTLAPGGPAEAAVVQWGTNGGQDPNYEATVNGDFVVAGNGVLACSTVLVSGSGTCADLHAATNANTSSVNDNASMVNSNTVSGFTTNSSSATVTIPSGATVARAFLQWSGDTGVYTGDSRPLCTSYSTARGVATLPSGSATGYQTQAAQLKVGSGAITSFAPDSLLQDATSANVFYYTATADVTSAFAGATTGSAVTVSAGNIWTPTGAGCYGGWSLTVVYDFGTYIVGNANSVPRKIIYYYGHVRENANDNPLTVQFNGFTAVAAGTRLGYSLYEGDRNITGDTFSYSRDNGANYTEIANSAGATGNIGIGRAAGSVRYTQTSDTSTFTNQSVDVAATNLPLITTGDSTATLKVGTSGDSYLLTSAVLSVPVAGIQIKKTYDGTADVQYRTNAEKATFTIVVTNTGAGTLQNIKVADDQTDCNRTLSGLTLAPLASTTYTCTANANTTAGYTSTATATATTVVGGYAATDKDSTTVAFSSLALTKTSALAAGATGRAGDVLTYTFTATNNGQGTLTGVAITDPKFPTAGQIVYGTWPSGTSGTLGSGQSVTATATYTLTQADVDTGTIVNTASTTGTDADGGLKPVASATRTTTIPSNPALTLAKTGAYTTGSGGVGSVITYGFTATNSGNVTLTNVAIADPHVGLSTIAYGTWPSGTTGTLLPGQSVTASATYTVTQSDVDAGSIKNTATVSGKSPTNTTATASSAQVSVSAVAPAPSIATTKSAAYTTGSGGVGSVVTYSFSAKNTGNVTLTGVAIADAHVGLSNLAYTWPTGQTAGTLAPGQTVTATATYTVTQADVDAGSIANTATSTGTPPSGAAVTSSASATIATATAAPAITFTKTGSAAAFTTGSTVTYTFVLKNTGNVTLTGATITDPLSGLSAITIPTWPSGTVGKLAPGDQVTGTATYSLKQSDVDAGSVVNTATASAAPPTGARVSRTAPATVNIPPTGALSVTKSGTYTSGSGAVGSVIRWDIAFTNTGNVTLTQVALTDSLSGLGTPTITWPGTAGTLAPGQRATAVASYTVTQADVDAGSVKNTASVSGRTPQNAAVGASSPQASVTTATAAPAISVTKTGAIAGGAAGNAGDVITFTFSVRNTGNVTLTGVAVTDPLSGLGTLSYTWPGTAGTLAPGQTATATASYTIKQTDVDAGSVKNTATASGTPPTGAAVTATSGQVTTPTAASAPVITTTKAGALANGATGVAGDTVNWTITLRNSGNVTLTQVSASDSLPGIGALTYTWPTGQTAGTLAPGQTATARGTSTLSQTDVDAGSVANVATGTGTPPTGAAVTSTGPATVAVAARGALALTKTPSITTGAKAGDVITYTFVARNAGNVTLTGVAITDPLPGLSTPLAYSTWPSGTTGKLTPGQQVTATATYTVKQTDVDAGQVQNTATANGTTPAGAAVAPATASATVTTVAAAPGITTTKSAAYTTGSGAVGSVITYSFSARNSGNVTLTGVAIADPLTNLSALTYTWPGTSGRLLPGQTVTATATYTLTQADVDRGSVVNRATGSGTAPSGTVVSSQSPQVTTTTAEAAPSVTLTKTGVASGTVAGSTVTYTFTLKNTGNVTLTGAAITDPLIGLSPITIASWPSGTSGTLRVGDQVTGTATYTLKQSDVDAGSVANTATATANPPSGAAVKATASASVPVAATGALSVAKSGVYTSGTGAVGSTIRWTIVARNTGNVSLTGVAISDSLTGLGTLSTVWSSGTAGTLAPNDTATATASYTVTQADVDAGSVKNTATATGRTPKNATVSAASSEASVATSAAAPGLSLTKTGAIAGGAAGNAGDVITYSFTLRNSGNVTLTGVTASDPLSGLSALTYTWPGTAGTLAPGQTATATASYTIKQTDVNAGSVKNTASAVGATPSGGSATASSGQVTTATATAAPSIAVTKSGALATGATGVAGDTVTWSFTLKNTGNVTLTGAGITDSLAGISALTYTWPGTAATLQPGQTATATATYALKQSDVDAGSVANVATGSGTSPSSTTVTSTAPATVSITARPSIGLTKTPSVTTGAKAGDTITYSFVIRNTGNTTLTGVAVTDPLTDLSRPVYGTWTSSTTGTLIPGGQVTATATYTVKQTDVDRGSIANTATASGTPPRGGAAVSATASATVTTVAAAPSIATSKSAVYTTGSGAVGSVITYTFTLRNSGNVTLTQVGVADALAGLGTITYTWPGTARQLLPGETATGTATYAVTQTDVDRGSVVNRATGSGTPPTGAAVTSQSAQVTTATATAAPDMTLAKSGSTSGVVAGSTVTYTFTLTNTGNVTLTGATIADPLIGATPGITIASWPSGTVGTLRVGDQVTGTATYTLKQSDVDAGSVVNTATATATPPSGTAFTRTGSATVPITAGGALTLGKTSAYTSGTGAVGSVITYTFTGRNTGNVTLTGVAISDPHAGLSTLSYTWPTATAGTLAPNAVVTATATYTVTQADVDRGSVVNTATISGRTPSGTAVAATSPTVTRATAAAAPSILTLKSASLAGSGGVGDRITYTITAQNTGNVTLTGVVVSDPMFPASQLDYSTWPSGTPGTLRPGDVIRVLAVHTITQAEVDSGSITNTASSTGTPPTGAAVSDPSDPVTVATAARAPAIALAQTGSLQSGSTGATGDLVTWSFTITNTGNTTLTSVQVTPDAAVASAPAYGPWPSGTSGTLLPGQSVTATATYRLVQADVNRGSVTDAATASGVSSTGTVTAAKPATVSFSPTSAITLAKSGAVTSGGGAVLGGTITYTFVAKNTGATTLTNVAISDPHFGLSPLSYSWPNAPNVLDPGQSVTATATYTIQQSDIDAGTVRNTASVSSKNPSGTAVSASSDQVVIPTGASTPGLSLTKSSTVSGSGAVNDVVTYTFTAKNTGNVTLTGVRITDPLDRISGLTYSWPTTTAGTLSPGQSVTATATYTIVQADVDRGYIDNRASVSGNPPTGAATTATSNQLRTPTAQAAPRIALTKTGSVTTGSGAAGSTITWSFSVQNTGNVTLSAVSIAEQLAGVGTIAFGTWPSGTDRVLRPNDTVTATATYTVTQDDVDAGSAVNTATASGTPPTGSAATSTASGTVPLTRTGLLTLQKTASGGSGVGSSISYTFTARNAGTVTLRGVTINDPLDGLGNISYGTWPSGTAGVLRPGESVTATATYPVQQADVDRGTVVNRATSSATLPDGSTTTATSNQVTVTLATAAPALAVTKTASATSGAKAGDVIRYTLAIRNSGNVTITGITAADSLPAVTDVALTWPGATGRLAPGETATGTASYRVTQSDVDAGSVQNTLTATGTGVRGGGATASGSATTTTTIPAPAISVTDAGALAAGSTGRAGDTVTWSYVLTNSGNVTLNGVTATESLNGATTPVYGTWPGGVANRLAPGQSVTVTTTYVLTQPDVDGGGVASHVTARGTGPAPASTAVQATADARVDVAARPSLNPVKAGAIVSPGTGQLGDTIRYTLDVTNTGNVTLYRGNLVDPLPGLVITSIDWPDNSKPGVLPPGTTVHGVGTKAITQSDIDLGYVQNTATTEAYTAATGGTRVTAQSNTVKISTAQAAPALTVTKTGAARAGAGVNDVIDWTVRVVNSGNVTVTGITVTDALSLQNTSTTWDGGVAGTLAPGGAAVLRGTTTIAQTDVDAGAVTNTASASGSPVRGPATVSGGPASATVRTSTAAPAIGVTKTAALASGATGTAGDLVNLSYTITNTGNTTLTGVQLAEGTTTVAGFTYGTWPGTTGTLLPGQSVTATAQHRLTQPEVDAGSQSSSVTATGTPPAATGIPQVSATATAGVTIGSRPSMAVTKNGTVRGTGAVGDRIDYDFSITNTGNVTLSLVDLVDALGGVSMPVITWPGQTGILAPRETATATATYTITQGDVDRGTVVNTATASGKPPVGDTIYVSSPASNSTVAPAAPALTVTKTASPATGLRVGDQITYTLSAKNSGNVTLNGVTASDGLSGIGPLTPSWPGAAGVLNPGQTATWTATYRVTQADIDAGSVSNSARVDGTGVRGGAVSGTASATSTAATPGPSIRVTDSGALAAGSTGDAGDTVTWTYVVTNTGDVSLSGVALTEQLTGATTPVFGTWPTGSPVGTLAPGQSVTATSTYALKQSDVNAGTVRSDVSTRGTPPRSSTAVTDAATASVTIPRRATYTVVKSAELISGTGQAGDTIRYYLSVRNTGNVTLYRGTLLDPLPGLGTQFPSWPDPRRPGTLEPGTGATGYADYPIQQADVDRGYIDNIATVGFFTTPTGNSTDNRVDVPSNQVRVNLAQAAPQLTVTKKGTPNGSAGLNDTISWTVTVKNTGNVTVSTISITDDLALQNISTTWEGGTAGTLAPGKSATLTGTSTIAQADLDRGSVTNTARATGRSARDNAPVTGNDATDTVRTAATTPQIDLSKTATKGAGWNDRVGSTVVLGYTIVNTGTSTLTGVTVSDPVTTVDGFHYTWPTGSPAGTLAPGARVTVSATHTVTQGDVDAGGVSSTATTVGSPPTGAAVQDSDTAGVTIAQTPDMTVTKSGAPRGAGGVGDVIDYRFAIQNTGNVTLTLVDLADRLGGVSSPSITWPGTPGVLLPGDTARATATYTITQADVDAGTVSNQAIASGKPPVGDKIVRTSNVTLTTVQAAAGALRVTKTATPMTGVTAGSTISYGIRVENTGNVTIHGIGVTDTLAGLSGFAVSWPGAVGTLAPGQAATATPTYRVTQADVDAGSVRNDVSASGLDPSGGSVSGSATVTSTAAAASPRLTVTDSGALAAGSTGDEGDTVTWTYVVTNSGNVTLRGVSLAEALGVASGPTVVAPGWPGTTGVLAPGQSVTATATYRLTQPDVDAGKVTSRITATGTSPSATSPDTSAQATADVTIAARRSLAVVKTGTILSPGVGAKGDTVRYRLEVTNTGNVTVYQGQLLDPLPGLGTPTITWPNPSDPGTVPPGQTVIGVADYALTQADVDRGYIDNQASVEASTTRAPDRAPANRVVGASNTVRVVTAQARPALDVVKTATRAGSGGVGDTISFRIVTTNSGNVTLTGVTVADALPRISTLQTTWPTATSGTLAPGQQAVTTATYTLDQADVDRGSVVNTASASGTSSRDAAGVSATSNTTTTPTATAAPAISVTDAGALASPTDNRAGGRVNWTYTVKNEGNVTLSGAQVADALPGVSAPVYQWTGTAGVLAPGASVTVTAYSILTQDDVDAGSIVSTVTATGTPPTGADATAQATAAVQVAAAPVFTLTKTASLQTAGRNGVGDTVVFRFVLANSGNVTLRNVTLGDTLAGLSTPVITWPTSTDGVLPPGTSATGTASYQIAQKDVDAGSVANQATATAQPPTGAALTAQSGVATQTTAAAGPAMTVTKTGALRSGTGSAGSVVRFTIAIRNSGNVTLNAVSLTDALPGLPAPTVTFPGGGSSLAPGATATGIADYTLTQADVDRGYVDNTATATATPVRGGSTFSVESNTYRFTTAQPRPSIQAAQSGAFEAGQNGVLGDTVDYTFTLTNSGNVTLTGVAFQNTVAGLTDLVYTWPTGQAAGALAPGQQAVLTAHHRVTQADVDAGVIRNVLSGSGVSPSQTAVSDAAPELVLRLATASTDLTLGKSGTARNGGGVGDTIDYRLTLTNSGTTTLHDAAIQDGLPGLSTLSYGAWPTGTQGVLPPNTSVTATATYVVTQSDVDAGAVVNTATASALSPSNARTTAVSPTSTVGTGTARPSIKILKSMRLAGSAPARAGDTVLYDFDVENTGNVTLGDVTVGDGQAGITGWTYTWPGTPGVLAPGQHLRATARYVLTQADIDRGSVGSTATTDGAGARSGSGTVSDSQPQTLPLAAAPAITVQKTADAPASPTVGSTITYTIRATNSGNVTLSGVGVTDPLIPVPTYTWPGAAGVLAPGQTVVATGTYTVTQADVDAGAVSNTATARGQAPNAGAVASSTGSATVQIPNGAAVSLTMSVRIRPGQQGYAGDVLEWSWVITNSGTRTLHNVTLSDVSPLIGPITFGAWPSGVVGELAPGQSVVASATSVIRPQDEGRRMVSSGQVSATGATAAQVVEDDASAAIQLPARPVPPTRPGSTGGLAVTGIEPLVPGALALLLLLWGVVLIGAGYRRRRGEG